MAAEIILTVATLIAAYIMIGYPLLLAIAPGRAAPAVRKTPGYRPTVSAIMAVFNGEVFIRQKLESILAMDYPCDLLEVLVVSDGSTDRTEAIVEEFADRGVRLIRKPRGGKSAALNAAFEHATGEILFFTDVRQPVDREALSHLTANFADPTVGAVTGEMRLLTPGTGEQADMDLYWRYEVWVRTRHSRIDSLFTATGCIYAMRRTLAAPIPPDTLSDDAMLPLGAFFRGYRVVFDPEALAFDYPAVAGSEFRRRWRTLGGLWQLHVRLGKLFTRANRMRFHFLSHKFSRLVLPWAMLAMLGATIALPHGPSRTFLLWDEVALLFLAALDFVVPGKWLLKRLSSPARTFLLMNAASLAAAAVFFVPAQVLWKPTRVAKSTPGHMRPGA
jgi:cellulose synthase/poly-beta-1,6-N-acetylglucosamine synthase-like glycosyltransferase